MIKKFACLRKLPQFGIELEVVFLDNGKSFYCLVPDDVVLSGDNVRNYRISNSLYEYFLFIDFPKN